MFEQLEAFFEQPTAASYRAARRQLLASCATPVVSDLHALARAVAKRRYREAEALIDTMLPTWSLSPALHDLAARVASAAADHDDLELERFMFSSCLDGILDTGDGSHERPYLVTYLSDEYDVLAALRQRACRQQTNETNQGLVDEITCDDGSTVCFDVTDLLRRKTHVPTPHILSTRVARPRI
ncbi:MAG: hypothetical protein KDA62_10945 [Planctomycetales bacterium]|nr:hypothetical protein [Planctomycetales bacterium]